MKKLLILILANFFYYGVSYAGSATGKVSSIVVSNTSASILFSLTSPITKTPRCNERQRFSINTNRPGGMTAYTALLEAKARDYEVTVEGLNTCANEWESEDVKNIVLH